MISVRPDYCTPGGSRTPNPQIRSLMLYPVELRVHEYCDDFGSPDFCAPGGSRTPNLQLRRLPLYPIELRAQNEMRYNLTNKNLTVSKIIKN